MSVTKNYLGFDLGASSGRAVLAKFDGRTMALEEVHRFANGGVRIGEHLHWNVLGLFSEMKRAMAVCARRHTRILAGIACDSWGVDFGLLDPRDVLIANPFHYRDGRTAGMIEKVARVVPKREIYETTGIQFLPFNTLMQLYAMKLAGSPMLEIADTLLMIPDLFHFFFSGEKVCESTVASTTQFYNPRRKGWAEDLLAKLGLPSGMLPTIVQAGTKIGKLLPEIVSETGLADVPVIAPACHDTGAAVAAVPGADGRWAYLSSGTWSLMGIETREPIINDDAFRFNMTNEGGVSGTIRVLKNIAGLWSVQECRRIWEIQGGTWRFGKLVEMAGKAPAFLALIDPDDACFLAPRNMPEEICRYCARTGQRVPDSKGAVIRVALESLALKYRLVADMLREMQGAKLDVLHMVGGGVQNRLLNQFTANALGIMVQTGPVEATVTGNILMQLLATGEIGSLEEGRSIVARSFPGETCMPRDHDAWEEAYQRFRRIAVSCAE